MKRITDISFRDCEDGELLYLSQTIADCAAQVEIAECSTTVDFSVDISNSADNLHNALSRGKKQELTVKVQTSDSNRDETLDLIDDAITLYCKSRKTLYRESAELLRSLYDTAFRNINLNNNSEQSVGINRFLEKMNDPEAAAAAKILRIDEDLALLKEESDHFVTFNQERAVMKQNDTSPRLQPSRRELQQDIRAFESFINHKIRKGSAVHIALAENINGPIAELMSQVKARQTRNENSAE